MPYQLLLEEGAEGKGNQPHAAHHSQQRDKYSGCRRAVPFGEGLPVLWGQCRGAAVPVTAIVTVQQVCEPDRADGCQNQQAAADGIHAVDQPCHASQPADHRSHRTGQALELQNPQPHDCDQEPPERKALILPPQSQGNPDGSAEQHQQPQNSDPELIHPADIPP